MLPTFVIGLREGLEAALIVGIIAAFLRKQGRRDLLRWVLAGVGVAVLLCVLVGVGLDAYSRDLPQRKQEGLETIIGILAVAMVTYMVIWMRRHSRELKGQLEGLAADALAGASHAGRAMIAMAFLAVIREGFETVVFLLAAFNESGSGTAAGAGALLGVLVAVALGYGIYRGGVRLNLSRFFRFTGSVLVLVAAGLVVNALHTAHEAGWLDAGQGSTVDLSWLVEPGSVQASLLTGMLGVQPHPTVIEVVGWLVYLVPVGCYVVWPPGRAVPARLMWRVGAVTAIAAGVLAVSLALLVPARPAAHPTTSAGDVSATVVSRGAGSVVVRLGSTGERVRVRAAGADVRAGIAVESFRGAVVAPDALDRPATLSVSDIARLNGGRLPLGVQPTGGTVPVDYRTQRTVTVWLDDATDRVVDLVQVDRVVALARVPGGGYPLPVPVERSRKGLPASAVAQAAAFARHAHASESRRTLLIGLATGAGIVAGGAALLAGFGWRAGRRRAERDVEPERVPVTARH
jgi:high-affinity iron transporter